MKIVFLCGSIEPGKDGVGDYTLRLCAELIRNGNEARIVSLNDSFVSNAGPATIKIEDSEVTVYRAPSLEWLSQNIRQVRQWINTFSADLVSLQYVPFAFHPKGLPFGLSRIIKTLAGTAPIHIMFHELWVGMNVLVSSKEKYWGQVQKRLIKSMVSRLEPISIHTQTHLYQLQLSTLGINAKLLPLFGNIRVEDQQPVSVSSVGEKSQIDLVIFGAIHPGTPFNSFASDASQYAQQHNITINLTFVGRCGKEQQDFSTTWQRLGMAAKMLGEQKPENISTLLTSTSIGLTTTPLMLVEKSGTVAAMLEHGLPVICLPKPWTTGLTDTPNLPPGVIAYTNDNIAECLEIYRQKPVLSINKVSHIANIFLSDLLVNA